MCSDQGAVEHQVKVVPVARQVLEHPLPHTRLRPAGEALVRGLPNGAIRSHCVALNSYRFTLISDLRTSAEPYESRISALGNPECRLVLALADEHDETQVKRGGQDAVKQKL